MNTETDDYIIELYKERDERAIAVTQSKYGGYCYKIALNILGDGGYAEEIVNDVMFKAWNRIPPDSPASMTAYLARITRNFAVNKYNSLHTIKRAADECALSFEELDGLIPSSSGRETSDNGGDLSRLLNKFLSEQKKGKARHVRVSLFLFRQCCGNCPKVRRFGKQGANDVA